MRMQDSGDPKKENFCKMLYLAFCPRLKVLSLTVFLVAINLIMFIMTLALGVKNRYINIYYIIILYYGKIK